MACDSNALLSVSIDYVLLKSVNIALNIGNSIINAKKSINHNLFLFEDFIVIPQSIFTFDLLAFICLVKNLNTNSLSLIHVGSK